MFGVRKAGGEGKSGPGDVGIGDILQATVLQPPKKIILICTGKGSAHLASAPPSSCNLGDPWRSACLAAMQTA